jgi:hypothetical protein
MMVCVFALSSRADAQPSLGSQPARAWVTGVSDSEQAIATDLYAAGNREFTESRFAQALAKYKEAIQHWDHPAIRYNMAVCLINLDQLVEARDNLERSLAYGARPLGANLYAQGLTYRKLIAGQLAHLKISCREPGAEVTLDGKWLFTGPGVTEQFVLPGEHQVVATKRGFDTASDTVIGVAGKLIEHDIAPRFATRLVRRWDAWKPWAVVASGGVALGAGVVTYLVAKHDFDGYDSSIESRCPTGCDAVTYAMLRDYHRRLDRAGTEQVVAFTLLSTAGAVVVAGLVGVVLNQPRAQVEANRPQSAVVPTPGGAVAQLRWRF